MKVKAFNSEIEIEPDEMKEIMRDSAKNLDEDFYQMLESAPAYGDNFDEWERNIYNYISCMFDDSHLYVFADFILTTTWWSGYAPVLICKTWLKYCGDNKLKPLLQECVDKNVQLFWE